MILGHIMFLFLKIKTKSESFKIIKSEIKKLTWQIWTFGMRSRTIFPRGLRRLKGITQWYIFYSSNPTGLHCIITEHIIAGPSKPDERFMVGGKWTFCLEIRKLVVYGSNCNYLFMQALVTLQFSYSCTVR